MATVTRTAAGASPERDNPTRIPALDNGDRLTAAEFERRYEAMPDLKKAELIEGVVYVGSPVSDDHGTSHLDLGTWLGTYRAFTPGLAASSDGTVHLDLENGPQ